MKIAIGCQASDISLQKMCSEYFGENNISVITRNSILGIDEIALIISVVDLSVATVSFVYAVLADRKKGNKLVSPQDTDNAISRRVLITKEGDINLEGYSAEEVAHILNNAYGSSK